VDRAILTKICPAQASLDRTEGSAFLTKNRVDTPAPTGSVIASVNIPAPTPATSSVNTPAPTSGTGSATSLALTVYSKVTDSLVSITSNATSVSSI